MTFSCATLARIVASVAGLAHAGASRLRVWLTWASRTPRVVRIGQTCSRGERSERGQALIETALLLPAIFILVLVVVDFGIALDRRELMQHGVREGARLAATGASPSAVALLAEEQSGGAVSFDEIAVCYVDGPDSGGSPGNAGDNVRVSGLHTFDFSLGSGVLAIPSIDMTPVSEARLETSVTSANAC